MSFGMRSSNYFSKYDNFSSPSGQAGGWRCGADSFFSQFCDKEERFRDTYPRPYSSHFGNRRGGGFGDPMSAGKGMQNYDMRGGVEYNERFPRSPLMRGMKRNMSPGFGFGGRSQGLIDLDLQGLRRPMARGRGKMRRGIERGGTAITRRGPTTVEKPPTKVPEWKKTIYHCDICEKANNNREDHAKHLKTKDHRSAVKAREKVLVNKMYAVFKRSQAIVQQARLDGLSVRYCSGCWMEYTGKMVLHKKSQEHREMRSLQQVKCNVCEINVHNRLEYECHVGTLSHIGNQMHKLLEAGELARGDEALECPEEYDENMRVGIEYMHLKYTVYCKACDEYFMGKDITLSNHCKTKQHFDNFKAFVVTRKIELEEKAKKEKEAAAAKETTDENEDESEKNGAKEDEEDDGEAENEDETIDEEAEDETIDGEAEYEPFDREAEDEDIDAEAEGEDDDAAENVKEVDDKQAPAEQE